MMTNLIVLILLLILSAFFSASEVAFISLTEARVETMVRRKIKRAVLVKKLKSRPRRLLITILIGNNIVNIAAASLATIVATDFFQSAVLGITTGIMTLLVLIFGEILPKSYAGSHAKKFAIFSAPFLYLIEIIGWPIIIVFEWLTNFLTGKHKPEKVSEDELKAMAQAGQRQGTIEKGEALILNRLFQMNDVTARNVMTEKKEINYLKDNIFIDEAADIILQNPHTRFPIIHDSLDNVVGLVHSRDVLAAFNEDHEDRSIKKIIRPILKTKTTTKIDDLLRRFQLRKIHMAIVQDVNKKTKGLVTLEDVLEELVGEIFDEYDLSEE
ncbi:MAG: hemolysin family protein [Candidatus Magasanikbacteria bacterium]